MGEIFPELPRIKYEGKKSNNLLSYKYYNPEEEVRGQKMKDILRFAVAYWHTFCHDGSDPFGNGTLKKPWNGIKDPMEAAQIKADGAFEFMDKLGVNYFCFHDRDIAPAGDNLKETNYNLDKVVEKIKSLMEETNIKLLWGTANLFSHPRYANGAATSCDADVFAYAAAQVKKAIEITKYLGGENYVFWGGREGYETLLNTNMKLEQDNMARFFEMAVEHAAKIGFKGQFLIEPKPKEPTKHQYDFDVANVIAFLRKYNLEKYFKINIEANHATLAGHNFQHELRLARINNLLGSIDINQGDSLLGWDTDQYPSNIYMTILAMYEILKNGGISPGGLNFDAKVRRPSKDPVDLFYGHILGMDSYAKGLKIADKMLKERVFEDFIDKRYQSYNKGIGLKIKNGKEDFDTLNNYILKQETEVKTSSGRQEMLESILNHYLFESD
ncbi:MAG TPA: xylose isomerase [Halanaerobiales bacterium]|nr:xylose isomerase [Halanaerobiales bacterium]